jgi:hypothetical protein
MGILQSSNALPVVFRLREVFYRERASNTYAPWVYSTGLGIVELPYLFLCTVLFTLPLYFIVGFESNANLFFQYVMVLYIGAVLFAYIGQLLASLMPNIQVVSGAHAASNRTLTGSRVTVHDTHRPSSFSVCPLIAGEYCVRSHIHLLLPVRRSVPCTLSACRCDPQMSLTQMHLPMRDSHSCIIPCLWFSLLAGIFIQKGSIPEGWQWMYHLNPIPKMLIPLSIQQFYCEAPACPTIYSVTQGNRVVTKWEWVSNYLVTGKGWEDYYVAWLIFMIVCVRLLVMIVIQKVSHLKR